MDAVQLSARQSVAWCDVPDSVGTAQTCRLHSHASPLEWLPFRLMLLGCEFGVHQPTELAAPQRGCRLARPCRRAYCMAVARSVEPVLEKMWLMWLFTVWG